FVVASAPGEQIISADGGFKWRRGPLVQRIGGLHVVMAINEHSSMSGRPPPRGVNQRMPTGRNDSSVLQTDLAQVCRKPVRAFFNVAGVTRLRADRGEPKKGLQFRNEPLAVIPSIRQRERRSHDASYAAQPGITGRGGNRASPQAPSSCPRC